MTQHVCDKRQSFPVKISVLKKRKDFLRVASARRKWVSGSMVVQIDKRPYLEGAAAADIRVGYTASKKVGNAVKRVRAKRRLREVVRQQLAIRGSVGHDYVLIARKATVDVPYDQLIRDFNWCLKRLSQSKPEQFQRVKQNKGQRKADSKTKGGGD